MKHGKNFGFLYYGIFVTVALSAVFGYNLLKGDMRLFLPGKATHGHHQIEMQCQACHVESFQNSETMQQACMSCHEGPLNKARDTHPSKKFSDPRNSDLLANLDATQCVTCHIEHSPEITDQLGVTLPEDFCFYCHQDVGVERKSHKDYEYDTCSNSGCHNYHDNRALYEKFLVKHMDEPNLLSDASVRTPNTLELWMKKYKDMKAFSSLDSDGGDIEGHTSAIVSNWAASTHAQAQVNCSGCHDEGNWSLSEQAVPSAKLLSIDSCATCHEQQYNGFRHGLHGMKLSVGIAPLQVKDARLPMKKRAQHESLTCSSCHDPHKPDLKFAATDSCLQCHDDEHSQNYENSSHATLWENELSDKRVENEGTGVSCATCHMPRIKKGKKIFVEHNQSMTLKPNSKMLRPVCLSCHGLEFSTAALADRDLIKSNFSRSFNQQHPSFEPVRQRIAEKKAKKKAAKNKKK